MDFSLLLAHELGDLDHDETVALFQELIDTGLAWQLQGTYGRIAMDFLESGECVRGN